MENFSKIHERRKTFLKENQNKDHIILVGKNNILLSAPHGVSQVRLGKPKQKEPGSVATALWLFDHTNCNLIAKTKNNNDDANFDENCKYRKDLAKFIKQNNIKYLIDIHGLAESRQCDINLGTHFGDNIAGDEQIFNILNDRLTKQKFVVQWDMPFMGGSQTVSGWAKKQFLDIWSLQLEINCGITNNPQNFDKYLRLLEVLKSWLEDIESKQNHSD